MNGGGRAWSSSTAKARRSDRNELVDPAFAVITAPNPGPFTLSGTNTYLIGAGAEVAIIDPGPDDAGHVTHLLEQASGRRVALILLTHDHSDHRRACTSTAHASGASVRR